MINIFSKTLSTTYNLVTFSENKKKIHETQNQNIRTYDTQLLKSIYLEKHNAITSSLEPIRLVE